MSAMRCTEKECYLDLVNTIEKIEGGYLSMRCGILYKVDDLIGKIVRVHVREEVKV